MSIFNEFGFMCPIPACQIGSEAALLSESALILVDGGRLVA